MTCPLSAIVPKAMGMEVCRVLEDHCLSGKTMRTGLPPQWVWKGHPPWWIWGVEYIAKDNHSQALKSHGIVLVVGT